MGGRGTSSGEIFILSDEVKRAIDGDNYVEIPYRDYKGSAMGFQYNTYNPVPNTYNSQTKTVKINMESPVAKYLYEAMPKNISKEDFISQYAWRDSHVSRVHSVAFFLEDIIKTNIKNNKQLGYLIKSNKPDWYKKAFQIATAYVIRKKYQIKTANDVEKTIQNSEYLQRLLEVK